MSALIQQILADGPTLLWPLTRVGTASQRDVVSGALTSGPNDRIIGDFLGSPAGKWETGADAPFTFTLDGSPMGTLQPWSFGAWVKTTVADNVSSYEGNPSGTILGNQSGTVASGWGIHNGYVALHLYDNNSSTWRKRYSNTAVNDGRWHYIGTVFDGTNGGANNFKFFVDGVLDAAYTVSIVLHTSTQIAVNRITAGYNNQDGYLGELSHVWHKRNGVVADASFMRHYKAGIRRGVTY